MSLPPESEAPLVAHLLELRSRLIRGLAGLVVVLLALLPFSRTLYTQLAMPLVSQLPTGQSMIATNPAGAFFAPIKLTFFVALFVAVPWLLYQAWAFVAPACTHARSGWRCRCCSRRCCCSTSAARSPISWCCRRCSTS
jgi:Sec-independent protein secretion pathway component TatC